MTAIHSNCQDEQHLITGGEGKKNTNICSHTETVIYNPFTFCTQVYGHRPIPTNTQKHRHAQPHTQSPTYTGHAHTNKMQTLKTLQSNREKEKKKAQHPQNNISLKGTFDCHNWFVTSSTAVSHFISYKENFYIIGYGFRYSGLRVCINSKHILGNVYL